MATNSRIIKDPDRDARTRADILTATRQLVQKHGLRKVTMEDIAGALGKKKSFLYYYYPGKREVVQAMVEDELALLKKTAREQAEQGSTPADRLKRYFEARVDVLVKRLGLYTASVALELFETSGPVVTDLLRMRQEFDRSEERYVARLLQQGMKDGLYRPMSAKAVEDMVTYMFYAVRGFELEVIMSGNVPSHAASRMVGVLDLFLKGLTQ